MNKLISRNFCYITRKKFQIFVLIFLRQKFRENYNSKNAMHGKILKAFTIFLQIFCEIKFPKIYLYYHD